MHKFFIYGLLLVLIAGCQQASADKGTFTISVTGDLETTMEGAKIYSSYNNIEDMPESISISLERGSGNNMAVFSLALPPEPEAKTYNIISTPSNPQFRSNISSVEASLFYANGSDSRNYTDNVTGILTLTEADAILSGSFQATLFLSRGFGDFDDSRQINVDGTFTVPNPRK